MTKNNEFFNEFVFKIRLVVGIPDQIFLFSKNNFCLANQDDLTSYKTIINKNLETKYFLPLEGSLETVVF